MHSLLMLPVEFEPSLRNLVHANGLTSKFIAVLLTDIQFAFLCNWSRTRNFRISPQFNCKQQWTSCQPVLQCSDQLSLLPSVGLKMSSSQLAGYTARPRAVDWGGGMCEAAPVTVTRVKLWYGWLGQWYVCTMHCGSSG